MSPLRALCPAVILVLLSIGCAGSCSDRRPKADAVAEAIRSGDAEALRKALADDDRQDEWREVTVDLDRLRNSRPLDVWISMLVKRNQLFAVRLLRADPDMCPVRHDGSSPAPKTLDEALRATGGLAKDVWDQVGLHRIRGTALHLAAFFCQPEMIKTLLDDGADVAAPDDLGLTPLHWVTCDAAAAVLLDRKADVNAASKDGWTPLHLAANAPIAKLLIARGANVHAKDACGNTPLHTAAHFGLRQQRSGGAPADGGVTIFVARDGGAPAVADGGTLLAEPAWLRLLARVLGEVAANLEHLTELLDVYGALLEAGADPNAANGVGSLPEQMSSSGGGDWDD